MRWIRSSLQVLKDEFENVVWDITECYTCKRHRTEISGAMSTLALSL